MLAYDQSASKLTKSERRRVAKMSEEIISWAHQSAWHHRNNQAKHQKIINNHQYISNNGDKAPPRKSAAAKAAIGGIKQRGI